MMEARRATTLQQKSEESETENYKRHPFLEFLRNQSARLFYERCLTKTEEQNSQNLTWVLFLPVLEALERTSINEEVIECHLFRRMELPRHYMSVGGNGIEMKNGRIYGGSGYGRIDPQGAERLHLADIRFPFCFHEESSWIHGFIVDRVFPPPTLRPGSAGLHLCVKAPDVPPTDTGSVLEAGPVTSREGTTVSGAHPAWTQVERWMSMWPAFKTVIGGVLKDYEQSVIVMPNFETNVVLNIVNWVEEVLTPLVMGDTTGNVADIGWPVASLNAKEVTQTFQRYLLLRLYQRIWESLAVQASGWDAAIEFYLETLLEKKSDGMYPPDTAEGLLGAVYCGSRGLECQVEEDVLDQNQADGDLETDNEILYQREAPFCSVKDHQSAQGRSQYQHRLSLSVRKKISLLMLWLRKHGVSQTPALLDALTERHQDSLLSLLNAMGQSEVPRTPQDTAAYIVRIIRCAQRISAHYFNFQTNTVGSQHSFLNPSLLSASQGRLEDMLSPVSLSLALGFCLSDTTDFARHLLFAQLAYPQLSATLCSQGVTAKPESETCLEKNHKRSGATNTVSYDYHIALKLFGEALCHILDQVEIVERDIVDSC